MARGAPDYGAYASKEVTASISDMGEVAARLGSIDIFDKRGDVVYFDAFEEPVLSWGVSEINASVYLSSRDVKSRSQAVELNTDAGIDNWASINKSFSILPSKRLGVEVSFGGVLAGWLFLDAFYHDGITEYHARARFDAAGNIYVWDGDLGDYTLVAAMGVLHYGLGTHFFHTMKLVADFETGKYVRLMFSTQEWDISAINLFRIGALVAPYLEVDTGRVNQDAAAFRISSVDDFILTQAEP